MKPILIALLALAGPLVVTSVAASLPLIVPGTQSNVTFTLTEYSDVFGSENASGFSTKIVKTSYGTKQLMEDLLAEGYFPQGETKISGWKLVAVDRTPLITSDGNSIYFYLVKSNQTPVLIPSSRLTINTNSLAEAFATTEKYANGNLTAKKDSFRSVITLTGRQVLDSANTFYDNSFYLEAIAVGGSSLTTKSIGGGSTKQSFSFNALGAVKLSPIIGRLTDNTSENIPTVIEGSIGFSAFTPLDIVGYPDPMPGVQ